MSDARWEDVALNIEDSVRHFHNAVRLGEIGTFTGAGIEPYRDSMALTHAIQSGHTSAEAALAKVLDILGEERPGGEDWHKTLLERLARPAHGAHARPPLLSAGTKADLDETRSFRHRVMHSYGTFDVTRSQPALNAARRLVESLPAEVAAFRRAVDPE